MMKSDSCSYMVVWWDWMAKSAHSVINDDVVHVRKNALVKNFTWTPKGFKNSWALPFTNQPTNGHEGSTGSCTSNNLIVQQASFILQKSWEGFCKQRMPFNVTLSCNTSINAYIASCLYDICTLIVHTCIIWILNLLLIINFTIFFLFSNSESSILEPTAIYFGKEIIILNGLTTGNQCFFCKNKIIGIQAFFCWFCCGQ